MNHFLELFDAYARVRAELRALPDEEGMTSVRRMTLGQAASLWNDMVEARAKIKNVGECICAKCGLRHGTPHESGQF